MDTYKLTLAEFKAKANKIIASMENKPQYDEQDIQIELNESLQGYTIQGLGNNQDVYNVVEYDHKSSRLEISFSLPLEDRSDDDNEDFGGQDEDSFIILKLNQEGTE